MSKKITIWTNEEYSAIGQKIEEIVAEKGLDYSVSITCIPKEETGNMLDTCINAGEIENLPDLLLVYDRDIQTYLNTYPETFKALDEHVDTNKFMLSKLEGLKDTNGAIYAYPISCNPVSLYYRRDILGELPEEMTWEEFIEIGKSQKADGKYLLPPSDTFAQILMQSAGKLFYDGPNNLGSENTTEVTELIKNLSDEGLLYQYEQEDNKLEEIFQRLQEGNIYSVMGTSYWYDKGVGDWAITKIPKNNTFAHEVNFSGYSWMVVNKESICDQSHVFELLKQLFCYYEELDNEAYFEMTRFLVDNFNFIPAIFSTDEFLNDLTKFGFVGDQSTINFWVKLGYLASCIYYGEYTDELVQEFISYLKEMQLGNITNGDVVAFIDSRCNELRGTLPGAGNGSGSTGSGSGSGTVTPRKLTQISVLPAKDFYYYGEEITTSSFNVTAYYDNDTCRLVSNFEINNLTDNSDTLTLNTLGEQKIKITYNENDVTVSEEISITVNKKLMEISLNTANAKLEYVNGERLSSTGMVVTARYTPNETKEISTNLIKFTPKIANFSSGQYSMEVTLSYAENGITATKPFTITRKQVVEIDGCNFSQDMGSSGQGLVNLFSGQLIYKHTDLATSGTNMPMAITHVYTPYCNNSNAYCVGNNWRLNVNQEITYQNGKWCYVDKDGKEHLFENNCDENSSRSSIYNKKLGLDLYYDEQNQSVKLVDSENNILGFHKLGEIFKLTWAIQNPSSIEINGTYLSNYFTMSIEYDMQNRPSKICFGKKINGNCPSIDLEYNGVDGLLSAIKYNLVNSLDNSKVLATFEYDSDKNLIKINKINKISNIEDEQIVNSTSFEYGYNVSGSVDSAFAVIDQSCKNTSGVAKKLEYEFSDIKKVNTITSSHDSKKTYIGYTAVNVEPNEQTEEVCLTTIVEYDNILNVYSFNQKGIVSQYSCELNRLSYSGQLDYEKKYKVYSARSNGFNYSSLLNSYSNTLDIVYEDFENGVGEWKDGEKDATTTETFALLGTYGLTGSNLNKSYTVTLEEDREVHLSMWVRGIGATVKAEVHRDGEVINSVQYVLEKSTDVGIYWQYMAISLGVVTDGDVVKVTVDCPNNCTIDEVRLTKMPYAMPADMPETVYDEWDRVLESSTYNPVDQKIYTTRYEYRDERDYFCNKLWSITVLCEDKQISKTEYYYYASNGLLSDVLTYGSTNDEYVKESYAYDENTGRLTSYTDCNGVVTEYGYGVDYDQITLKGTPNITVTNKYFTDTDILEKVVMGSCQNSFVYNDKGYLSKVNYGTNSAVEYSYDGYGNLNKVNVGGVDIVSFTYDDKHLISQTLAKDLISQTLAKGHTTEYTYDDKDRLTEVKENSSTTASITYEDAIDKVMVTSGGATYTSQQVNKDGDSLYEVSLNNNNFKALNYAGNATTEYRWNDIFIIERFSYTTDALGRLSKISRSNNYETPPYVYDDIGRLTEKGYAGVTGETKLYKTTYTYRDISLLQKSTQIASETFSYDDTATTYNYEYYPNGNVSKIYKDNTLVREYIYDQYDRLEWEKNFATSIAYNYEYDGSGNILAKHTHIMSNGYVSLSPTKTQEYVYETTNPDRLDYYQVKEGQAISYYQAFDYDALGNPTTYNGMPITWQGRKLMSVGDTTMQYDYNGLRTRKGERYYYWHGNILKMEYWIEGAEEKYIYYYYDESGISGISYCGTEFYFQKNIFGDVVAIYDVNGNLQCTYEYDAWGNHKIYGADGVELSASSTNIGNINPIRYRGYYWDSEFSLYYLQSRYYDPALGRFISPDSVEYLAPDTIGGLNLYAYCLNNPVNYKQSPVSSGGSVISSSISAGDSSVSAGGSSGGGSLGGVGNPTAPWWASTAVGAIPDFILGMRYLAASGMHSKFAYATNTRYMHPIMGGTWRWFGKSSSSFGTVAQGTFKQILTGDARAGFGAIAKSVGGVVGLNALVNFGFNLYENNWQVDSAMLVDTAIDTAIGVGSYYLATGAMSLATAGLLAAGVALPGIVVVGGVVILSIGIEHLIRAISGYWD